MTTGLRLVSDDEIAAYQGMIAREARTLEGIEGAEFDDLFQEGQIIVWRTLEQGVYPSKEVIRGRMLNWVRTVARQRRGEVADDALLDL